MNYATTEEQSELGRAVRQLLEKECTPARIRQTWEDHGDTGRTRWARLAELGALAAVVPEAQGGIGLADSALALVLEETGYFALPEPFLETAAIVVPVLRDFGTPQQQDDWLPRLAAGEAVATVQFRGSPIAPGAESADIALVEDDHGLHLVGSDRFEVTPVGTADEGECAGAIVARLGQDTLLDGRAAPIARARAAAAGAAVLNGVSRRLLDESVSYAGQRVQFNRVIGSFQAVKHLLADVAVGVETARPSAWFALAALEQGIAGAELQASSAKAAASRAAATANMNALQIHGGIGFTWEHHLHFWLKKGKALESRYGSARYHDRILGDALLDSASVTADFGPDLGAS